VKIVFVAMPSELYGGSGVRVLKVMPHMKRVLEDRGVPWYLYIPCFSSILLGLSAYVSEGTYDGEALFKHIESAVKENSLIEHVPGDLLSALSDSLSGVVPKLIDELYGPGARKIRRLTFLLSRDRVIREAESRCVEAFMRSVGRLHGRVIIHSMHESYEAAYASMRLTKALEGYGSILLQIEPFNKLSVIMQSINYLGLARSIRSLLLSIKSRSLYLEFLRSGRLRRILSVSAAPLINSGIDECARRFGVDTVVLKPGNAVDPSVTKYRSLEKEPYAVFWARLCKEKGIFDLLRAWKIISREAPDVKLIVAGRFVDDRTKEKFLRAIKGMNLRNLKFLGYVKSKEELYSTVSKAKVLIYPSYSDAFPLVVLEALALGINVVAYDIPAITSVYGHLPAVKVVKRGDTASLASETLRMIRLREEEYVSIQESEPLKKFLELHTSWYKVAESELKAVLSILHAGHPKH